MLDMAIQDNNQNDIEYFCDELLKLEQKAEILETECLFKHEADQNDCFMEINAGAGGTESHDWAEMILRMYTRWAERQNFKSELSYLLDGEEAGIKSATLKITGRYAYGWAKSEAGVHRLVRISPFNAAGKRQTSFASVWVYPIVDDKIEIEIVDKDLKIDTYRASGAGGQHVNTTESAVRITHLPTGLVAQCQNDRSQHKNKEEAMRMLKSRMYEQKLEEKKKEASLIEDNKSDNGWGHQIRSYVLHPYQMVKDARTNYEMGDTNAVLDGKVEGFMNAYLKLNASHNIDQQ